MPQRLDKVLPLLPLLPRVSCCGRRVSREEHPQVPALIVLSRRLRIKRAGVRSFVRPSVWLFGCLFVCEESPSTKGRKKQKEAPIPPSIYIYIYIHTRRTHRRGGAAGELDIVTCCGRRRLLPGRCHGRLHAAAAGLGELALAGDDELHLCVHVYRWLVTTQQEGEARSVIVLGTTLVSVCLTRSISLHPS